MNGTTFSRALLAGLLVLLGTLAGALTGQAAEGTQSALTPVAGQGAGRVVVSSTAGQNQLGTFAAQVTVDVHGARPDTAFVVQRATDDTPDGDCTGDADWFTPPGAGPLVTSAGGAGATHFARHTDDPPGSQFDIIFRLLGSDGTVLVSQCMTVTVK